MMFYNNVTDADEDIDALAEVILDDSQEVATRAQIERSTMSYLRTPVIIRNLLVMGSIWCMTWFNFYIFKF
jgi:hypothetical protein